MVVGFDQHGHVARTCVLSQFVQGRSHAGLCLLARYLALVGFCFAAKNTHVWRSERFRQIDEPPRISQFLRPFLRIGDVLVGRTADARNPQLARVGLAFGLLDAFYRKNGMRRQIQITFETPEFNGRESVLTGKLQDFVPFPSGATQRRKCERLPGNFPSTCNHRRQCGKRKSLDKLPAAADHYVTALLSSSAAQHNHMLAPSAPYRSVMDSRMTTTPWLLHR